MTLPKNASSFLFDNGRKKTICNSIQAGKEKPVEIPVLVTARTELCRSNHCYKKVQIMAQKHDQLTPAAQFALTITTLTGAASREAHNLEQKLETILVLLTANGVVAR